MGSDTGQAVGLTVDIPLWYTTYVGDASTGFYWKGPIVKTPKFSFDKASGAYKGPKTQFVGLEVPYEFAKRDDGTPVTGRIVREAKGAGPFVNERKWGGSYWVAEIEADGQLGKMTIEFVHPTKFPEVVEA